MREHRAVHPPKIVTFDVAARVNIDTRVSCAPVDEYRETPFGLYMSRAMVGRPTATGSSRGCCRSSGSASPTGGGTPAHVRDQDFYLDIAQIDRHGDRWRLTDHYLDIVRAHGAGAEVLDVDEFVTAVRPACSTRPPRSGDAPHATGRGGIAAHGHDLDAWLAGFGIALDWRART